MAPSFKAWLAFGLINLLMLATLAFAVWSPPNATKKMLLPGKTTHGHYQIEMDCAACHDAGMGVQQDSCLKCHEAELKEAKDTHPASKFADPTNADRLALLDATKCVTCHREHTQEQTRPMGVTLPDDYCYHCHQETLETRPSHRDFAFDSCTTAGCHNYHDNRALYENFLLKHFGEPDILSEPVVALRTEVERSEPPLPDAPIEKSPTMVLQQWQQSAHAGAGVNCKGCHLATTTAWGFDREAEVGVSPLPSEWHDEVPVGVCANCHEPEAVGFGEGKHGMRLANGLSAMQPSMARQPMHVDASHREMTCNACHPAHGYDTRYAAVEACLSCHADSHSQAYRDSGHYALWQSEQQGKGEAGTGVSCATCHMPRVEEGRGRIRVQHNQNNNLQPNEKMVREVCLNCHGLQYTLNALADPASVDRCFADSPSVYVESLDMAKSWFDEKQRQRAARNNKDSK